MLPLNILFIFSTKLSFKTAIFETLPLEFDYSSILIIFRTNNSWFGTNIVYSSVISADHFFKELGPIDSIYDLIYICKFGF